MRQISRVAPGCSRMPWLRRIMRIMSKGYIE
jgi:hypothetical protein